VPCLPQFLSSPPRCCQKHDCCYTHLRIHQCRPTTDNYKYTFSQGDIQCCEYWGSGLKLEAQEEFWLLLPSKTERQCISYLTSLFSYAQLAVGCGPWAAGAVQEGVQGCGKVQKEVPPFQHPEARPCTDQPCGHECSS
jgi:hypothetical protein